MSLSDNMKGALLMSGATAGYTLNDACMKTLSVDMPLAQSVFLRGVLACALLYALGRVLGGMRFDLGAREWMFIAIRAGAEVSATFCFLSALTHMPIANLTAILQALPLTVALAAWAFLGEPLGWRRLLAILVGLVGVVLIVRPGSSAFDIWSVYALVAIALITLRDLVVRKMAPDTPSMTVALVTALVITVLFGLASFWTDWVAVDARGAGILSLAALFILIGYVLSVTVMRFGDIGFVAPFRYTGLIWALVLGLLLFREWPDGLTLLGAAIVVATGLFTLWRERQSAKLRGVKS